MYKNVKFYKVTNNLYKSVSEILEDLYTQKLNIGVQVSNAAQQELLDKTLWTFRQKAFIPHATEQDPYPDLQPIYITTKSCFLNNPEILVFLSTFPDKDLDYDKKDKQLIIIFDDECKKEVNNARECYKYFKNLGYQVEYHQL